MMTASLPLPDLYRDTVLEHSRNPRHFRRLETPDRQAEGHNTLCGDKVTVYARLAGGNLAAVSFEASGCAISIASASMMSETLAGHPLGAVRGTIGEFMRMFDDPPGPGPGGDLAALSGVRDYPSRVRCATLPWQTLRRALDALPGTVSTE